MQVVCDALRRPNESDVFQLVDERLVRPLLRSQTAQDRPHVEALSSTSVAELIASCHKNLTVYEILRVEDVYNVENLREWRQHYGIGDFIDNLKRKIRYWEKKIQ